MSAFDKNKLSQARIRGQCKQFVNLGIASFKCHPITIRDPQKASASSHIGWHAPRGAVSVGAHSRCHRRPATKNSASPRISPDKKDRPHSVGPKTLLISRGCGGKLWRTPNTVLHIQLAAVQRTEDFVRLDTSVAPNALVKRSAYSASRKRGISVLTSYSSTESLHLSKF